MSKPAPQATKVVFKSEGKDKDLFVFIQDPELYKKWKAGDHTIPLVNFVDSFQIFDTSTRSHTGVANTSSRATISNILNTENVDDAIKRILQEGELIGPGNSSVEK
ncbi:hypothetical protein DSO57_1005903 [Entomophthora muscae]|uniref:Uncharacterized protein n=1 Tax=Entomophthora muscae TaxID=34485 RepID=A0ACC2S9P0_9FUNG|nr:hypothetical protein DSO57_1005903 [Entomophthora muscae]